MGNFHSEMMGLNVLERQHVPVCLEAQYSSHATMIEKVPNGLFRYSLSTSESPFYLCFFSPAFRIQSEAGARCLREKINRKPKAKNRSQDVDTYSKLKGW